MNGSFAVTLAALVLLPTLCLAQAPATPTSPVGPGQPAASAPAAQDELEPLAERQMSLMEARILSRQGDLPRSLKLYEVLRATYPDDQEVYEDFLETLVSGAMYERALFEFVGFRKKFGNTSRSERIESGLYAELKRPQYGLEILERAMRGNPSDLGLWADLGVQRMASRDTGGAVQAFSQVLEADPDNQAARDALHELLLERRPKLEVGVSVYDQGRENITSTYSLGWSMALGERTRLFSQYDQVHVSRPDDTSGVTADLAIAGIRAEHDLTSNLTLEGGLQTYVGGGDGLSPMAGLAYSLGDWGRARLNYAYHLPWYDVAEAVKESGSQDRVRLEYMLPFREVWTAYAEYEGENYRLGGTEYGYRWAGMGSLSRLVWRNPDITLAYTFQRAEYQPYDKDYTPVDIIRRESTHMGTLTATKRLAPWLEATVSGGIRHDLERGKEGLMFSPQLVFHPMERLRFSLGWDYSSEADTVAGGESNNYSARFAWTW